MTQSELEAAINAYREQHGADMAAATSAVLAFATLRMAKHLPSELLPGMFAAAEKAITGRGAVPLEAVRVAAWQRLEDKHGTSVIVEDKEDKALRLLIAIAWDEGLASDDVDMTIEFFTPILSGWTDLQQLVLNGAVHVWSTYGPILGMGQMCDGTIPDGLKAGAALVLPSDGMSPVRVTVAALQENNEDGGEPGQVIGLGLRGRGAQAVQPGHILLVISRNELQHCRVCGLDQVELPWGADGKSPTFWICECCGVEFGYEDTFVENVLRYRQQWLDSGAEWSVPKEKPADWHLDDQLLGVPSAFAAEAVARSIELLSTVVTTKPLPGSDLPVGTHAVVVDVFDSPQRAYEIEVVGEDGQTVFLGPVAGNGVSPSVPEADAGQGFWERWLDRGSKGPASQQEADFLRGSRTPDEQFDAPDSEV